MESGSEVFDFPKFSEHLPSDLLSMFVSPIKDIQMGV